MHTLIALLRTNITLLLRNRGLIITSLGLAVISILVFGYLFGGGGNTKVVLGVVDQDHSNVSTRLLQQLKRSDAVQVYTGSYAEEQQALKDGQRDAFVVVGSGFEQQLTQGKAHLQVYYNQSDLITAATARITVQSIVEGINRDIMHQPGPLTLNEQGVAVKNLRTIDFVTPGMLGMLLMWANLSVGSEIVLWREMGITKRLAATPLRPISMLGSQMFARLVLSIIQGIVLLALAAWIFNVHIYGDYGWLLLVVSLGALTMLAIGFAIASFVKKSDSMQPIMLLVSFPMMFLGGSYFNVNGAPAFLQPLVHAMPLYYLNDALRQVINYGGGWSAIQTSVLVMLAWIVAAMLVAWRAFRWL